MTQHERTHTGENPYKCISCDDAFGTSNGLKQHVMYNHTDQDSVEYNEYVEKKNLAIEPNTLATTSTEQAIFCATHLGVF